MDILQEYALYAYNLYTSPAALQIRRTVNSLQLSILPALSPYLKSFISYLQDAPGIVSFGALLIGLIVILQVMAFVRRIMMYPVRVAWWVVTRAVLVAVLGFVVKRVGERGMDGAWEDAVGAWGWARQIGEFWWRQYEGYLQDQSGQQQGNSRQRQRGNQRSGQRSR